jgi:hypothetical protein
MYGAMTRLMLRRLAQQAPYGGPCPQRLGLKGLARAFSTASIAASVLLGQLLSGHAVEQSLAVYRALALSDVVDEYKAAMQHFPVR